MAWSLTGSLMPQVESYLMLFAYKIAWTAVILSTVSSFWENDGPPMLFWSLFGAFARGSHVPFWWKAWANRRPEAELMEVCLFLFMALIPFLFGKDYGSLQDSNDPPTETWNPNITHKTDPIRSFSYVVCLICDDFTAKTKQTRGLARRTRRISAGPSFSSERLGTLQEDSLAFKRVFGILQGVLGECFLEK